MQWVFIGKDGDLWNLHDECQNQILVGKIKGLQAMGTGKNISELSPLLYRIYESTVVCCYCSPPYEWGKDWSLSILGVATKEGCFWWSEVIVKVEPASDKLLYPSLVRPEHLQLRELRCHGSNGTEN